MQLFKHATMNLPVSNLNVFRTLFTESLFRITYQLSSAGQSCKGFGAFIWEKVNFDPLQNTNP